MTGKATCALCAEEGAEPRPVVARGMCRRHYTAAYRRGTFTPGDVKPGPKPAGRTCGEAGCSRPHVSNGYCQSHLYQARRDGMVEGAARCSFEGCGRLAVAGGLCFSHRRQERQGKPLTPITERVSRQGTCPGPGCDQTIQRGGYCMGHYRQVQRGQPLRPIVRGVVPVGATCSVEGCGRPTRTLDGLCRTHRRYRKDGDPDWQRPIPTWRGGTRGRQSTTT